MIQRRKKRKPRQKDWAEAHDFAFTHDLARHRKADRHDLGPVLPVPEPDPNVEPNAMVVSHSGQWAFVLMDGREVLCMISESLTAGKSSILAPGDRVRVEYPAPDQPFVSALAPRRTKLSRPAQAHAQAKEQVIAANIDVLVVVSSVLRPRFKPGVVDRFLIAAQAGGVEPVLVVNKMDLVENPPDIIQPYHDLDFPVVYTSCETGQGIEELRGLLSNRLAVVGGQSGVGKSSILNNLSPTLDIETQEVSQANEKGRHTTTSARLYMLEGNIRVVDTPGIRQLGLWEVSPQEVAYYFPEIAELSLGCKFRNCTHTHEPDCAVRDSVEAGGIPPRRYRSYLRIRESLDGE
jgi:ribosome biogenesis GTPase